MAQTTGNPLNDFISAAQNGAGAIKSAMPTPSTLSSSPSSSAATTTSAAASATSSAAGHHGLSSGAKTGIIVGVVVGVVFLLGLLLGICCCLMLRKRRRRRHAGPMTTTEEVAQHPSAPLVAAGTTHQTVPHGRHSQAPSLSQHPALRHPSAENPFTDNAHAAHDPPRYSHHGQSPGHGPGLAGATAAGAAAGYGLSHHHQKSSDHHHKSGPATLQKPHHEYGPGLADTTVAGATGSGAGHGMHHHPLKSNNHHHSSEPTALHNTEPSALHNSHHGHGSGLAGATAAGALGAGAGYGMHHHHQKSSDHHHNPESAALLDSNHGQHHGHGSSLAGATAVGAAGAGYGMHHHHHHHQNSSDHHHNSESAALLNSGHGQHAGQQYPTSTQHETGGMSHSPASGITSGMPIKSLDHDTYHLYESNGPYSTTGAPEQMHGGHHNGHYDGHHGMIPATAAGLAAGATAGAISHNGRDHRRSGEQHPLSNSSPQTQHMQESTYPAPIEGAHHHPGGEHHPYTNLPSQTQSSQGSAYPFSAETLHHRRSGEHHPLRSSPPQIRSAQDSSYPVFPAGTQQRRSGESHRLSNSSAKMQNVQDNGYPTFVERNHNRRSGEQRRLSNPPLQPQGTHSTGHPTFVEEGHFRPSGEFRRRSSGPATQEIQNGPYPYPPSVEGEHRRHSNEHRPLPNAVHAQGMHHGLPPALAAGPSMGSSAPFESHSPVGEHYAAAETRQQMYNQHNAPLLESSSAGDDNYGRSPHDGLSTLPSAKRPVSGTPKEALAGGAAYVALQDEEKRRRRSMSGSRSRSRSQSRRRSGGLPTNNKDRPPTPFGLSGIGQPYEDKHVDVLSSSPPSEELRQSLNTHETPFASGAMDVPASHDNRNTRGYSTPPQVPSRSPNRQNRHSTMVDSSYEPSLDNTATSSNSGESYSAVNDPYKPATPNRSSIPPWERHQMRFSQTPPTSAGIGPPAVPWDHGDPTPRRHSPRASMDASGRRNSRSPATSINGKPRRLRFEDLQPEESNSGHRNSSQQQYGYDSYDGLNRSPSVGKAL